MESDRQVLVNAASTVDKGAPARSIVPDERFPLAKIALAVVSVGLAVWIGVRIKTATADRATVAKTRDDVAKAAVAAAQRPLAVRVTRGAKEAWQAKIPFEGTLMPIREADLGFKVTGRVAVLRAKVGDHVRAGDVLATLEQVEAGAQVRAAQAAVRAAEAQVALADDSAKRVDAMVKTGSQAEATGFQATQQKALALAQLDGARAQLALAQSNLDNHALSAPFAGLISRAPAGPGGIVVVMGGQPQFHLSDMATLKLVGTVSELDARLVRIGAPVELQRDTQKYQGKVLSVLASVEPATRRVPVEAELPNDASAPLLAGTFARAIVEGGASLTVLRLPHSALRPGSQDELFVVRGGRVELRKTAYVVDGDGSLLVRSGVAESDDVLVDPKAETKDGDKVEVQAGGKP